MDKFSELKAAALAVNSGSGIASGLKNVQSDSMPC